MPTQNADANWMKNHPLEGDNIITGFYNFLAKKNPKTMKPCRDILVPDTIVFEHNFPRGWFTTDIKAREIMRKQGRELDAATIEKGFTENVSDACPVVATYMCMQEEDLGNGETETKTLVEVLNKDTIGAFLARKTKQEGILQKFVMPKGYNNSVIKVVWSPRVCMVQRRTNKHAVLDRKRAEGDPFSTVVTYEGPNFLSEECTVSGNVATEAKHLCGHIVQHFYYTEHKFITRMVVYFKSDAQNNLWFLWCSSLRVSDRNTNSEVPVTLAAHYAEPTSQNDFDEDKLLWEADQAYLQVTNDEMFYETYMKKTMRDGTGSARSGRDGTPARGTASTPGGSPGAADRRGKAADGTESDGVPMDWSTTPPLVQETHARLSHEREEILALFEDLFYKAKSHAITSFKGTPYILTIPARAQEVLTENGVRDLLQHLQLTPTPMTAAVAAARTEEDMEGDADEPAPQIQCRMDMATLKTPVTKLSDEAKDWIDAFFDAKEGLLRYTAERLGDDTEALRAELVTL